YWLGGTAFDASLERYTYLDSRDMHLVVRRMSDNQILARLPPPPGIRSSWVNAWFSPDGRFLALHYATPQKPHPFVVWDLPTEKLVLNLPTAYGAAEFTADSQSLAVVLDDNRIGLYRLAEGKEPRRLGQGFSDPRALRFDPGGRRLACAQGQTL